MTDLPETMKAMVLTGHGGLDMYAWHEDWPTPEPDAREVVIRVAACGLNNTDVNMRAGWYDPGVRTPTTGDAHGPAGAAARGWNGRPVTFPRIQGADAVGTVVAVGPQADPTMIGHRVMVDGWQRDWSDPDNPARTGYFGSECDGGFAEYTKVDPRNMLVVQSTLSDAELATFQCSYTAAEGMLVRAGVTAEDTVLVPGASGGVGGALVQLARRRGARVIALAAEEKQAAVAKMGPDRLLPRAPGNLRAALGTEKVTVVADTVGGGLWPQLVDALERGGRYTCAGAIAGPVVDMDLRQLYLRDLTFCGSTIVPPHVFADVVTYVERGEITPVLAATYPLRDLAEAQAAFIEKRHSGKIVVTP